MSCFLKTICFSLVVLLLVVGLADFSSESNQAFGQTDAASDHPATKPHPAVGPALKKIEAGIQEGPFQPDWSSLQKYEVPQWYKDAKFGIFIHWGVYSVPAFGSEWYPRQMYINRGGQPTATFSHHVEKYGDHKTFGYKDFIPDFKAEKFDAAAWAKLFKETGAKYVVPVAEHHDGFPMYDCSFTRWDASEMGPKRDIVAELAQAVRDQGMKFGVSSHRAFNWMYYVRDKSFDNADPQYADLYGRPMPYLFQENAADYKSFFPPQDQQFKDDWLARTCELVDKYNPDLVWFDFAITPDRKTTYDKNSYADYLKKFAAYYYNQTTRNGSAIGVINYKFNAFPDTAAVLDKERSKMADIRKPFWQTDTAVSASSWGYTENQAYKTADRLVDDLVDIVSKNGCLLLNVGPRPDGTIPEEDQAILKAIGGWLKINGEAIYDTTHWKVFGEGPTGVSTGHVTESKDKRFTDKDIRFTVKGETLYAIGLDWPEDGTVHIESLKSGNDWYPDQIQTIKLLGSAESLNFERTEKSLSVSLPQSRPSEYAYVLKITKSSKPDDSTGASKTKPGGAQQAQADPAKTQITLPEGIDTSQSKWYQRYKSQPNIPQVADMRLNKDAEPDLTTGFESLFNGVDLNGWTAKGGGSKFEVSDGQIVGTCVPGQPSTYLCTDRADYKNFIFTCDVKWEVDGNTGVMFRASTRKNPRAKSDTDLTKIVFGPQLELEGFGGFSKGRGWSGGIYGQSCGGYFYPLWLQAHRQARSALKQEGWNRVTIAASGNNVKTWLNGVPCANWDDDGSYASGAFGLQVHSGKQGKIRFANLRVKELE